MPNLNVRWPINNDILVILSSARSSTMAPGSYINNAAGFSCTIWRDTSTADLTERVLTGRAMAYTAGSNGKYTCVIQSTDHTMSIGTHGMAVVTLSSGTFQAEWRNTFVVIGRGTT